MGFPLQSYSVDGIQTINPTLGMGLDSQGMLLFFGVQADYTTLGYTETIISHATYENPVIQKPVPIGSMYGIYLPTLPTFTIKITQMQVNMPYMDPMGYNQAMLFGGVRLWLVSTSMSSM